MVRLIDISNKRFGSVVVIKRHGVDSTGKTSWSCECDCGKKFVATGANLKNGNTKSCGCRRSAPKFYDRTGYRYSRLIVTKLAKREDGKASWHCACDCGKTATVSTAHLISGHTRSCGCFLSETSAKLAKKNLGGKKESHPRWRSDLTESERKNRRGEAGRAWSQKVKERNNFICVVCASTEKLHSHHLTSYAECEPRRHDITNGVCLCHNCHRQFHKKYGYVGFTRSDFFEFAGLPDPGDFSIWRPPENGPLGNAIKYILRADHKGKPIEDLQKARWYIDREIQRRKLMGDT